MRSADAWMRVRASAAQAGIIVSVACVTGLAGAAMAQPVDTPTQVPQVASASEATLALGDPAPALDVTEWVRGEAVDEFEPGRVYVVDFFATWAPGADEAARALSRVQVSMGERVRVIGIASANAGRGETADSVRSYVAQMGPALRYAVAFDAERAMFERYMTAMRQAGVPHSFVIDGRGRVAWHGHPSDPQLSSVVDLVVKGEWSTEAYQKLLEEQQRADGLMARAVEAWNAGERERTVEILEEIFQINPSRFGQQAVWKFHALHVEMGQSERAYEYAKDLIEGPMSNSADALADLAWVILEAPPEREYDDIVAEWAARRALVVTADQHGHAWASIALIEGRRQNFDEAFAAWDRALGLVDNEYLENVYLQKRREAEAARDEAMRGG